MKRHWVYLLCVFLVMGCGGEKAEKQLEGVKAERNFIEEGFMYLKKADIPKAIQSFDRAIQQDPTNAQNYILVGQVYMRLNNFVRASDSFSAAIRVEPTKAVAYFLLGQCQAFRGQTQDSLQSFQKSMILYKAQNDEKNFNKVAAYLKNLVESSKQAAE